MAFPMIHPPDHVDQDDHVYDHAAKDMKPVKTRNEEKEIGIGGRTVLVMDKIGSVEDGSIR